MSYSVSFLSSWFVATKPVYLLKFGIFFSEMSLAFSKMMLSPLFDLWFSSSSTTQPRMRRAAHRSDMRLPGSMEGSCRRSPSRTTFLSLDASVSVFRREAKRERDTMEDSSTATTRVKENFHGLSEELLLHILYEARI